MICPYHKFMDIERRHAYLKMAESFGMDISDTRQTLILIALLKFMEARMIKYGRGEKTDREILEELGLDVNLLNRYRDTDIYRIANRIILAEFLADTSRREQHYRMFAQLNEHYVDALERILRIASDKVYDENGERIHPPFRDQVSAFREINASPIVQIWTQVVFTGSFQTDESKTEWLRLREALQESPNALDLDQIQAPRQSDEQTAGQAPHTGHEQSHQDSS